MVADIPPPIGYEVADPARCQGHGIRRVCPGLIGVNTGDPLEEVRRKILSANVLDGVDELVDAKMGGVDRSLAFGAERIEDKVIALGDVSDSIGDRPPRA